MLTLGCLRLPPLNLMMFIIFGVSIYEIETSTRHNFPFLFCLPWTCLFMSNSAGVSRKADDAYPKGAPGPCS